MTAALSSSLLLFNSTSRHTQMTPARASYYANDDVTFGFVIPALKFTQLESSTLLLRLPGPRFSQRGGREFAPGSFTLPLEF